MNLADQLRKFADDLEDLKNTKKANPRIKRDPDPETVIIEGLKAVGIPYTVAKKMFDQHSAEFIARKIFLFQYRQRYQPGTPVKSVVGWLTRAVENDYNEPDHFIEWLRKQRDSDNRGQSLAYQRLIQLT